jgi:N-acetyl-anhydromuramoyl-L-alanine amidase
LQIILETGLLQPVTYLPSPHCDERPQNTVIDMVVVHSISLPPGQFATGAIEQFFCNKLDIAQDPYYASIAMLTVSAHLLIKRTGVLTQFVPFTKRAWHAGDSSFCGKTHCNDFSIGIELEGTEDIPYEQCQYKQLSQVVRLLMRAYPAITLDRLVGHMDIAPGRKTDPGQIFDWAYLKGKLA